MDSKQFKKNYPALTYILGGYVSVEAEFDNYNMHRIIQNFIKEEDNDTGRAILLNAAQDIKRLLQKHELPVATIISISNVIPENRDMFTYLINMYHVIEEELDVIL